MRELAKRVAKLGYLWAIPVSRRVNEDTGQIKSLVDNIFIGICFFFNIGVEFFIFV